jgi:two-component system response regulator RegA
MKMLDLPTIESQADRTLLLVDDDEAFVKRLARAMEKRGFLPETA